MERELKEVRSEVNGLTHRLDQLDTHLTGAGVKGSLGVLGDVAKEMDGLAQEVRGARDNRSGLIAAEVRQQLNNALLVRRASYWDSLSRGGKWLLGSLVGAVITVLVSAWVVWLLNLVPHVK